MLYSGVTGKISIKKGSAAAVELLHMTSFNVEITKTITEVQSFGEDYTEKVPGIKNWSASADGSADLSAESGQAMLIEAFEDGAVIEGAFYLDEDTFLIGNCLIESISIDHAADGKADVSISLSGSGKPEVVGAGEFTALTLVSVSPAANATEVSAATDVVVTFSNKIRTDNIFLINTTDGVLVPAAKTWNTAGTAVTLDPTSALGAGDKHGVVMSNVVDVYGQTLADAVSYFTVAS